MARNTVINVSNLRQNPSTVQGIFNGSRLFLIDLCVVPENIHIQLVEGLWKFREKGALKSHKL